MHLFARPVLIVLLILVLSAPSAHSDRNPMDENPRAAFDLPAMGMSAAFPYLDYRIHDNGFLHSVINNNGIFGNIFRVELPSENKQAPSFYHPKYSRIQHGYYAGLWVGGIVYDDTLVTTAIDVDWDFWIYGYPMEFWPDVYPFGEMVEESNDPSSPHYDSRAKAEQQYEAVYADTIDDAWYISYNPYDERTHKPLNIEVTQTSYSWSYKYARDFIIVDYHIRNMGIDTIHDAWVGIYYVGCVRHRGEQPYSPSDDVEGYIYSVPHEYEECGDDLLRAAWIADADGQSFSFTWDFVRTSSTFAIAPLRVPEGAFLNNFNWWEDSYGTRRNWGPRKATTPLYPLRHFAGGLGIPMSDADKYYIMAKPEVDYSGYEAAVDYSVFGWLPPHEQGGVIARGHLPEMVTSFGPFTLEPQKGANFSVVMCIGENLHYDPWMFRDVWDSLNPYPFQERLDFSDLITNLQWAKKVFDNPGIDTDGDGDSGSWFIRYDPEFGDSLKVFCEGDGVPDFQGASPPPPPELRVIPGDGRITVRWNGRMTENYFDALSYAKDFEGYRVYLSRSTSGEEAVLLASWDWENYNRYTWDRTFKRYLLRDLPMTLDSLRALYGEDFEPLDYSYADPMEYGDNLYYFVPVDYNSSDFLDENGIHKRYPDATLDTADVDEEGRMRYYEWEYIIEDLLPSVPYWVSVTAFDFGHPPKDLEPLESYPEQNMVEVFAVEQVPEALKDGQLDVYCYPNPYRVDGDYTKRGFENRLGDQPPARSHTIYWANLPHKCTISIYSLDGDLVRKLEHEEPEGSGTASVHSWNMITRNTQAIVSGLYYWVVESAYGNQIGKLAILK